jgi:Protein of unknown function (DUF2934)
MTTTRSAAQTKTPRVTANKTTRTSPAETAVQSTPDSVNGAKIAHEHSLARRHERIAIAAYLKAESRGFAHGYETADWLSAQSHIDAVDAGEKRG